MRKHAEPPQASVYVISFSEQSSRAEKAHRQIAALVSTVITYESTVENTEVDIASLYSNIVPWFSCASSSEGNIQADQEVI